MTIRLIALTLFSLCLPAAQAQTTKGVRINGLKAISDRIDDVTTPEAILKSFVKPGMSDAERSKALWTAAVRYRHQTAPPNEFLADDWEAHDPVKLFNVYGYCMCCCCSSIIESLNRLDGRDARGRILNGHSVPEVSYGGGWHMFDCSLITLFPKADGSFASVDDISSAVKGWLDKNPDYRKNGGKLIEFMRQDGWMGWKKGPELVANSPFLTSGYYPARTHGWDATMQEYDRNSEAYEYGYQLGHRALFSLRPGESFTREAGNRGLHVNMEADPSWDGLKARAPENDLVYLKQFLPGYSGGIVGNGVHRYAPTMTDLAAGAERFDNLAAGADLHVMSAGKPGVVIIQMTSPYVYLGGRIRVAATGKATGDKAVVSLSTNSGRTFTPIWRNDGRGATQATIDFKDRVLRRYAYWVKIELVGEESLNSLVIESDLQHAPRTLPWLGKGSTKITIDTDGATTATRTVTGRITPATDFKKNESTESMGVRFDNMDVHDGSCWWKSGVGTMTVPIETPGDMSDIRFGAQIRARGPKDVVKMLLSFDDGKTWTEAAQISGPTPGTTRYFKFDEVPASCRRALLKYELTGNNTVGLFSFRVDADYRDPLASTNFKPFTVTHRWNESGQDRSAQTLVTQLPFSYAILAGDSPEMVSVSYEMPASRRIP